MGYDELVSKLVTFSRVYIQRKPYEYIYLGIYIIKLFFSVYLVFFQVFLLCAKSHSVSSATAYHIYCKVFFKYFFSIFWYFLV